MAIVIMGVGRDFKQYTMTRPTQEAFFLGQPITQSGPATHTLTWIDPARFVIYQKHEAEQWLKEHQKELEGVPYEQIGQQQ